MAWVILAVLVVVQVATVSGAGHHRFGYTKPEQRRWSKSHESCAGKHQSPIAISSGRAISLNIPAIEFVGYNNLLPGPITMHNNGHSVSFSIPKTDPSKGRHPYIFGGKMENEYELEGLHFHWGDKNNRGAEHVLNDVRYPMEMHIIHRNKKYKNVAEALGYSDGLTVLGFFYQVVEQESSEIGYLLPGPVTRFCTYKGSLTTPPCSEAVTWVLFPDLLTISLTQIRRFRVLDTGMHGSPMVDNYRALQPIGNRRVFVRKVNSRNTAIDVVRNEIDHTKWDWTF
ncbi:hypothetical protein pipiens_003924 [Culex pipiens pipiens]|uniref:Alpha-carbonic anhydrase domain-containing protein n=1 Tax=Culex pipiens pipiens TaxID=38569 RepID=A0ABD1CQN4_CULPP